MKRTSLAVVAAFLVSSASAVAPKQGGESSGAVVAEQGPSSPSTSSQVTPPPSSDKPSAAPPSAPTSAAPASSSVPAVALAAEDIDHIVTQKGGFKVARSSEMVLGLGPEMESGLSPLVPGPVVLQPAATEPSASEFLGKQPQHHQDQLALEPAAATAEEERRLVAAEPSSSGRWVVRQFMALVSLGLLAVGVASCIGLSKKIEKEEKGSTDLFGGSGKGFVPGALVTVTKDFMSNGEPPVRLKAGQSGVIQKIDAVGDALIRFADHGTSQWVYEQNYENLRVR